MTSPFGMLRFLGPKFYVALPGCRVSGGAQTSLKAAPALAVLLCLAALMGFVGGGVDRADSVSLFGTLAAGAGPPSIRELPSGGNAWATLVPGSDMPPARSVHTMAYDSQSDRVILFGGSSSVTFGDTWAYDLGTHTWTNASPAPAPSARIGHEMAYDAQSDRVILFGGFAAGTVLDDTWSYDLNTNTWVDITPFPRPPGRSGHSMAYDSESDRIILFGGASDVSYLDDTWSYDFNTLTWTDVTPGTKPAARQGHSMAYDSQSDRVMLFGGLSLFSYLDDTWSYDANANTWTDMGPATVPPERFDHAMAYDSESDRVVMFGGFFSTVQTADTWTYDFGTNTWADMAPPSPPVARYHSAMAYDSQSDRVILFGGNGGSVTLGDTWAYDLNANAWTVPVATGRPPPRFGHGLAYDSQSVRTILVGGFGSDGFPRDDTWSLDVGAATWTNRTPATQPPGGDGTAVAYDVQSDRVILYRAQETWAYDYETNTWTNMNPPASPTADAYHAMAYDAESDRVVLFGGFAAGPGDLDETWVYDYETNTWANPNPATRPLALTLHAMASDAQSDRIILFGGARTVGPSDETWSYDVNANTWANLNPATAPTARSSASLAYDSESDRVILFGGVDAAGANGETWSYDFETNTWLDANPTSRPDARGFHALAYDAQSDLVVLFGGSSAVGYPDDTWAYRYFTAPSGPSDFQAIPGNGQVDLSWQAPADDGGSPITGYRIYRGPSSGTETFLVEVGAVLAYTDLGLTNGVTYFYQVAALNAFGEGPRSAEVSATPATVPDAPANLVATPGDAVVVLGWDPPASDGGSPVSGYVIYRGTAPGGETPLVTVGAVLTYTDTAVTNSVTYYYQVAAVNAAGEGARSAEVPATPTPTPTVPSAPQNLQAVPGDTVVTLTWDPPSSTGNSAITNYRIFRGTASGSLSLHATVGDVLTFADTGLTNSVTYYYQVSAVNGVGEGPRSAEVAATPALLPSAPQNLQAMAGNGLVSLTWQPPASNGGAPIVGYTVYRGTSPGGAAFLATVGAILSYTDFGVTNGVTYYYQVAALNGVGEGPRSAEVAATPAAGGTVPSAPRSLTATGGDGTILLSWSAPASSGGSAITNYWVYRGTASGSLSLDATLGNVLTYTDTTVTNGVTYYYQMTAVNSIGEGPRSEEVSATPATTSDTTQPTVTITSPQSGATLDTTTVTVSGTAADDVGLARVEISADGTTWILATGTTSWTGTLTLGEGTRTIYARATDPSGNIGTASVTVTITPAQPVGGLVLPWELLLGFVVIGAIVIAVAWAAARRRRRPRA